MLQVAVHRGSFRRHVVVIFGVSSKVRVSQERHRGQRVVLNVGCGLREAPDAGKSTAGDVDLIDKISRKASFTIRLLRI